MRWLLIIIALFFIDDSCAQDNGVNDDEVEKEYFSEQIALVRNDYMKKAKDALIKGKFEYAKKQYKKMISQELEGTYMDNFNVSCLNTNKGCINDYNKPIILMTYASWCVPGKGEIPAINHVVDQYSDKIDFVVLFWDDKKNARRAAKDINNDVHIVYVDELRNRYAYTIKMLKHSLGFPKIFTIGSDKKILQIENTKGFPFYKEPSKAVEENKDFFKDLINNINEYEDQLIKSAEADK